MATTQTFVSEIQGLGVANNNASQQLQTRASNGQQQSSENASSSSESTSVPILTSATVVSPQQPQAGSPQSITDNTVVTVNPSRTHPVTTNSGQQQPDAVVHTTGSPTCSTPGPSTPQFIAVAVADAGDRSEHDQETVSLQTTGQPASAVHQTYVQYVDQGTGNLTDPSAANIYAASNGQMTYSVYSVSESGGSMYTPASASYFNTAGATALTYSQVSGGVGNAASAVIGGSSSTLQGQIVATAHGNAYVVQGLTAAGGIDADGGQLAHATRASPATDGTITYLVSGNAVAATPQTSSTVGDNCSPDQAEDSVSGGNPSSLAAHATRISPATVQWLLDNYETAEGVSLPRRTLYHHYLRHCSDHKIEPVNAASFGKLIRSVFLGLRTRRLGTRGNSKYHYYGLRVKPDSPLVHISEDHGPSTALRQQPLGTHKRLKVCSSRVDQNGSTQGLLNPQSQSTSSTEPMSPTSTQLSQTHQNQTNVQQQQHQQYLGDSSTAIPHFINIDLSSRPLPDGITLDDITTFVDMYRDHCESFLDVVTNLQFSMVEMLWQNFWRCQGNQHVGNGDADTRMSKEKLNALCESDVIQDFVRRSDYQFYQNLVDVLIPDVLRPIPSSLTQAIRNFAKSLEGWLASSMTECPDDIVKVKVSAVSAFAQTLRRYTSLNHLAQAARAVLQNSSQIHQMLADLNRVDFHNVQEQASWVCQCDDIMVQQLEQDFKATLQQQNSLEQWAAWLEGVVTHVLRPYEGKLDFPKAARQFLLKWSFYSSMVIRDLTLRSAASFGSFHLIRLLYDEYMFYLVEHRVAEATGETPIAVMGEFIGLGTRSPSLDGSDGLKYSASLVTNSAVTFSHQLCSERSTDSESSTTSSTTGHLNDSIDIQVKRVKVNNAL